MNDYEPAEGHSASEDLPIDTLVVPLTGPEGQTVSFKLPLESFWLAFRAAEKLELDETLDLINFAWKLLRDLAQQGVTNVEHALTEIAPLLADPLAAHAVGNVFAEIMQVDQASEFAQLVRSLIDNDYMNAEVIRFDGGIRFQPK